MRNALTDLSWIPTSEGLLTPAECLRRAHEIQRLDLARPAFEVSACLRVLCALTALVLQHDPDYGATSSSGPRRLSATAIDAALAAIGTAADLDEPQQPFLQRPPLEPANAKDTARCIEVRGGSVRKLAPSIDPDRAQAFWTLSAPKATSLPSERAVLALAVFHHFFPAGNNKYAGDKTQMGAPGLRFPGAGNTATEFVWNGSNLLDSALRMIPVEWTAEDAGLPAWADRTAEHSRTADGTAGALWSATWSSNAAACAWDDDGSLIGVRVGGIPPEWGPPTAAGPLPVAAWKGWWDLRNIGDPFFFYRPNAQGEMKAQRLDIGRSTAELAVEWNAQGKAEDVRERSADRVRTPATPPLPQLMFFRHQVFGTASSPSIRASQVMLGVDEEWSPRPEALEVQKDFAATILRLHRVALRPFIRRSPAEKSAIAYGGLLRSDALAARLSTTFWREMAHVFERAAREFQVVQDPAQDRGDFSALAAAARDATVAAVFETTESIRHQANHKVEHVRASARRYASLTLKDFLAPTRTDANQQKETSS